METIEVARQLGQGLGRASDGLTGFPNRLEDGNRCLEKSHDADGDGKSVLESRVSAIHS
jgi:hypothetical protein